MNFPDTATLEPVCSLSGDALNTTPRPGGLPQRVWPAPPPVAGQAAVAGLQGHPPCLSPAQDRTAPFLSAPRPAQLHQSRRRAVHVERGVRSVRRAPAGGCPLLQRPILRTPLFDPPRPLCQFQGASSKLAPSTLCLPPYEPVPPVSQRPRVPLSHPWVSG